MTAKNKKGLRTGIVNAEDENAIKFEAAAPKVLTYGLKKGEIRPINLSSTPQGSSFSVHTGSKDMHIELNLPGEFNVANSLAAIGAGLALKMPPEAIEKGVAALKSVEGRMTNIDEGQDFSVIVDFAHTPDSFDTLF